MRSILGNLTIIYHYTHIGLIAFAVLYAIYRHDLGKHTCVANEMSLVVVVLVVVVRTWRN